MKLFKKRFQDHQYKFIFGATTATIINLGLIVGFGSGINPKLNIISSILVIALADNLTDSLGIHIYQETQELKLKYVWLSTIFNFLTRLFISIIFILIVLVFPLNIATFYSIILGLLLLSVISYLIAKQRNSNPLIAIAEHLALALIVIISSYYLGHWVVNILK